MAAQGTNGVVLGPVARNGFPARGLTSRLPDSTSGEWLLAYQAEQTKYLRAMFASVRSTFQRNMTVTKEASVAEEPEVDNGPILNKAFILKHCYVENPHDLYVCSINGCGLSKYVPEDFQEFDAVEEVNANDNKLSFETFATFPFVQELEISLNHIKDVTFHSSHFTHLQVLNISYNILSDSAILTLGLLPNLKELHLTGNDIVALPVEMSRAIIESKEDGSNGLQLRYPSLEKLWLDDNKLTDLSTFAILAGLRRLKILNLDNNEIYSIPQLKLLGADNLQKAHAGLQDPQTRDTFLTQSTTQTDTDMNELNNTALRGSLRPSQINLNQTQFSLAPFPCLETLSIANNMIIAPEGLVAVGSWPSLNTLIVHGNPVTRFNKGMPPLLKSELIDPFGIKIVRHVPGPVQKPKVAERASDFVKVSQEPPPVIPKQPLLAIEHSHSLLEEDTVSYGSSSTTLASPYVRTYPHTPYDSVVLSNDSLQERRPTTVGPSGRTDMLLQAVVPLERPKKRLPLAIAYRADPNSVTHSQLNDDLLHDSGVFITQVRDDGAPTPRPYPPHDRDSPVEESITVDEEYKRNLKRIKESWKNIPDKFKGFEALLESDSEDDETIPSDIARCTRALKHALDHPLLLADSSRLKHRQLSGGRQYLRRKSSTDTPRPKALPSKVKEVQQVLHTIKNSCNTLETNLSTVLESPKSPERSNKTLKKESKDLLKEIQLKYANVRKKSLRTTSELSSSLK